MNHLFATLALVICICSFPKVSGATTIRGQVQDADGLPVAFANAALYRAVDSTLIKVETTDEAGLFLLGNIGIGNYFLTVSYLGAPDLTRPGIIVSGTPVDLGILRLLPAAVELAGATVTATRALVEIKPDRTVFNVQGTINAVGDNGLELLRKAPGVTIDNNDNINVLSRSGVLVYVDGKRLPLTGTDLANYLRNLTAEQIDRIDIITNPGAKYEAEGNAGILDIRLKKNEDEGANGSVSTTLTQGRYRRNNVSLTGNYRNERMNVFGQFGGADGRQFSDVHFQILQNEIEIIEETRNFFTWNNVDFRTGVDYFLGERHTIGVLVSGQLQHGIQTNASDMEIGPVGGTVDSVLLASSRSDDDNDRLTLNLNYRFTGKAGRSLNADLDYGGFRSTAFRRQPNVYTSPDRLTPVSEVVNLFDTPRDIDIYTLKLDYEIPIVSGQLTTGSKLSRVVTDNTFLFLNAVGGEGIRDNTRSNRFEYTENVYAAYLNYAGNLGDRLSYSAGARVEVTDATGDLTAFAPSQREPPVELSYLSVFPSAGVTYQLSTTAGHSLSLNYGRRINRPDYNVLNPFRIQVNQLSFENGNPNLNPEIVDNLELGYTHAYRYNFKVAVSRTSDQITRLIGPDPIDPRAGFISWENLAEQTVLSFNAALPVTVTKNWDAFFNLSASHIDNQADYGDGAVVDLQAFSYNFFTQQTFKLPWSLTGEVGGFYGGPGIWGGVFEYNVTWSLNLGLQRRFLADQLTVKLKANDLFYEVGWSGQSSFNGQRAYGGGNYDSRNFAISLSYGFGNQRVKSSRRKTGLEEESKRVN